MKIDKGFDYILKPIVALDQAVSDIVNEPYKATEAFKRHFPQVPDIVVALPILLPTVAFAISPKEPGVDRIVAFALESYVIYGGILNLRRSIFSNNP